MAEDSWPTPQHNSRAVTDNEYELLAAASSGDGVIGAPSDTSVVFGDSTGRQVKVRTNKSAYVRGRLWQSGTSTLTLAITANTSGSTRIDRVVLRLDKSTWAFTLAVKAGTPGAGVPALTQNTGSTGTYEFPLARVTVVNNAATIAAADVVVDTYWLAPRTSLSLDSTAIAPATFGRLNVDSGGRLSIGNGSSFVRQYRAVGVSSRRGIATSFATSTWSFDLPMTTEEIDTDGIIDIAGAAARVTVPWTGVWRVWSFLAWPVNTTGSRILQLRKNGAAYLEDSTAASANSGVANAVDITEYMTSGTYWSLGVWQSGGATLAPMNVPFLALQEVA
jgi:hypothetical protein